MSCFICVIPIILVLQSVAVLRTPKRIAFASDGEGSGWLSGPYWAMCRATGSTTPLMMGLDERHRIEQRQREEELQKIRVEKEERGQGTGDALDVHLPFPKIHFLNTST
jgi:hypothetical protein